MNKINHIYNGNERSDDELLSVFILRELFLGNKVDYDSMEYHFEYELNYESQPFGRKRDASRKIDRRVQRIEKKPYEDVLSNLFSVNDFKPHVFDNEKPVQSNLDQAKIKFFDNVKDTYDVLKHKRGNDSKAALRSIVTAGLDDNINCAELHNLFGNDRYRSNTNGIVDELRENRSLCIADPSTNTLWGELSSSVTNTWGDGVDTVIRFFWQDDDVVFNDYSGRKYHYKDEFGNPACELKQGNMLS